MFDDAWLHCAVVMLPMAQQQQQRLGRVDVADDLFRAL